MEALHLIKLKPKQNIGKWKAESPQNKPTLHGCHGVFSPRSRSLARRPLENSRAGIGIDISPMPVRHGQTPARRLHLPESEPLWKAGRGFVVLP